MYDDLRRLNGHPEKSLSETANELRQAISKGRYRYAGEFEAEETERRLSAFEIIAKQKALIK